MLNPNCPPRLRAVIEKGWSKNPQERPKFAEILVQLNELDREMRSNPEYVDIPVCVPKSEKKE